MYNKILVPMALDHGISPETLEIARALRAEGGEIIALHVHEAPQSSVKAYLDEEIIQAGFDLARQKLEEQTAGIEGILPMAAFRLSGPDNGIDCIVIGSPRPGLRDYFLGSTAARVVRHASCAVHVQRTRD